MVVFPKLFKTGRRVLAILLAVSMILAAPVSSARARTNAKLSALADDLRAEVIITLEKPSLVDAGFDPSEVSENPGAEAYLDGLKLYQAEAARLMAQVTGETPDIRGSLYVLTDAITCTMPANKIADVEALRCVSKVTVQEGDAGNEAGSVPGSETKNVSETGRATANDVSKASARALPETIGDSADNVTGEPEKLTLTAGEMVEKKAAWSNGYTGAGMRIAIIDDGTDPDHPSFAEDAFLYSLEETAGKTGKTVDDYDLLDEREIKKVLKKLHAYEFTEEEYGEELTTSDLYRSAKIPFGFNYADISTEIFNGYSEGHGTHVAGIAAANRYVKTDDGAYKTQELGVAGVAPDAQIIAMHVFSSGADPFDYAMAIEDALLLGADAINLSLGSGFAGYADPASEGDITEEVFGKLHETDTVLATSAGNNGAWADYEINGYGINRADEVNFATAGSPATFKDSLSVASNVNTGTVGAPLIFNNSLSVLRTLTSTESGDAMPDLTDLEGANEGREFDYIYMNGIGKPEEYEGLDVSGKIVLVDRGETTFAEKHAAAVSAGAIAVVICNNVAGGMNFNIGESPAPVPCVAISLGDTIAITECSEFNKANATYTGKVKVSEDLTVVRKPEEGYDPSDFSSWGVPEDLSLKPEIMAPGESLYSCYLDGGYDNMSGTSMASPMIAGISALVIQYIEETGLDKATGLSKRALTQSLLTGTAVPVARDDGTPYSPRKQGAGLANVRSAISTPAYILVGDKEGNDGKVKAELHDDPERKGVYSFDFTVNNLTPGTDLFYDLGGTVMTESLTADDTGLLFTYGESLALSSKVSFDSNDKIVLTYDLDGNGKVNSRDAKAFKKYVKKSGKKKATAVFKNCPDKFDLNRDGVVNKKDANIFAKYVKTPSKSNVDLAQKTLIVSGEDAKVNVKITLSDDDRAYLENFKNGMFVDGFISLSGDVDLSVPFLAFYGNWSDSSMYEPFDYIEYRHGSWDWWIYTVEAPEVTNYFLFFSKARGDEFKYASNPFVKDDAYLPERNAFSSTSGDVLEELDVTYIRNARYICAKIENAETGDVYYEEDEEYWIGAYYDEVEDKWEVTSDRFVFGWKGTDADGNPLPEGTKVLVSLTSVPEYYGSIEEATGRGTTISLPLTIDNTAPTVKRGKAGTRTDKKGVVHNTLTVRVKDENYVAAVIVYAADKETVLGRYAVNQTKPGVTKKVVIDKPDEPCYVAVYDYAGNEAGFELGN